MNDKMQENRLRGTDVFPFVLYEMPYNGQPLSAAFHWQEDVEILAVKCGDIKLTLEGTSMILHTGTVVCINPGQLHGFSGLTSDAQCDILIFPLPSDKAERYSATKAVGFEKTFMPFEELTFSEGLFMTINYLS